MPKTKLEYIFSDRSDLTIVNHHRVAQFDATLLEEAVVYANDIMLRIGNFDINIAEVLGMRNLSAFVGEVFARAVAHKSDNLFISNPHQDGYPDLLLLDPTGQTEYARLADNLRDKFPFSPFVTGGIEIKATCGDVQTPAQLARQGKFKPQIGDSRIELIKSYVWKAHHRETNNLLAILWDFVDGVAVIVAVFYSSDLQIEDWSPIQHPFEGGGRTTSVSIMQQSGVRKMYEGWLCVLKDARYVDFLNTKNQAALIPSSNSWASSEAVSSSAN